MSLRKWVVLSAASAAVLAWAPGQASASGYALREQSGSMLGQAFAGQNAYTMDPSVIYFNPAGMSALDGTRASAIASGVFPSNRFNNDGSTTVIGPAILGGDEGGDAGQNALVPAGYGMTSFGDFRLGVGVNSPFGLVTSYDDEWIGRYAAITSSLKTINVNPVASYQVADWLAIGAGVQIQRIDARLTNAELLGLSPGGPVDGLSELTADDLGLGFTAGALITPMPGTQIGIGFRSSVSHTLKGDAEITSPTGVTLLDTGATAKVKTPETVGLSIYQQVTDRLALMGTAEWTNWSRFDELRVEFDAPLPDSVVDESWHDTWFFAAGANYRLMDNLLLRVGVAFDETPVRDSHRTARLPDEDRLWLALGATYDLNDWMSFDIGYTHIFVKDASINERMTLPPGGVGATGTLRGEYENSVDVIALQANIRL